MLGQLSSELTSTSEEPGRNLNGNVDQIDDSPKLRAQALDSVKLISSYFPIMIPSGILQHLLPSRFSQQ